MELHNKAIKGDVFDSAVLVWSSVCFSGSVGHTLLQALGVIQGGKKVQCIDLFPLLHNRMNRENQSTPEYIGEFDGIESLPKGDYPAIYFWIDHKSNSSVRLSFNTPKLERWCIEEAIANGLDIKSSDLSVKQALATLEQIATPAFTAMIDEILKTDCNAQQIETRSEQPSKAKKWWQFW